MNTRRLGRTNIEVSELGFGGALLGLDSTPRHEACACVRRAVELGISYVDTAPRYGRSEEVLGEALDGLDSPVILSTKLGGDPETFRYQDRDCLLRSVEESLRRLRRDSLDVLLIHEPDKPEVFGWWAEPGRFEGPVLDVLTDLKKAGVVRFTGVGGTTTDELARLVRTGAFDVVLTAYHYSVLWREAEHTIFPAAKEHDVGIVVGSPLHSGALAQRDDALIERGAPWLNAPRRQQFRRLYALLDEFAMPLPELALRFVLSNPDVASTLMGMQTVEEVEQNAAAARKGPLPPELLARLDAIVAIVPTRPEGEPFVLPFGPVAALGL